MNLETLTPKLQNVKRINNGGITARCPAHDDQHNSLSVSQANDGKILVHCHAGCAPEQIAHALGIEMRDLFSRAKKTRDENIVATHNYTDEHGKTLFQTVRYEPKEFKQRRPDGAGGWIWNLENVRRVPFRLPELLAADPDKPVFIVEGEKDVNGMERLGLIATTNPMGANKWLDEYAPFLRGRDVIILPDNDDMGHKHAHHVARSVLSHAASVKILELPNLPPKGDVSDWIAQGGTKNTLLELVAQTALFTPASKLTAPRNSLALITSDEILQTQWQEPVWAVPNLLPVGLTILAGAPKLGKSWLGLQLAHAVAAGGFALGEHIERGAVMYLALEDTSRRLQERMTKQGWTLGLPAEFMPLGKFALEIQDLSNGGGERLALQIETRGYRLVVIDTLSRSIRGDQNDADTMTRALTPLQEIAHLNNCAILLIDHHRKQGTNALDVISDIMGSTAKGAMCDTAWGLYRERGKELARLAVTGREISERNLALKMDWERGFWTAEGDADALQLTERRKEVLDAVRELGRATLAQICEAIGQDKSNTRRRLQDLTGAGLLKREGEFYLLP